MAPVNSLGMCSTITIGTGNDESNPGRNSMSASGPPVDTPIRIASHSDNFDLLTVGRTGALDGVRLNVGCPPCAILEYCLMEKHRIFESNNGVTLSPPLNTGAKSKAPTVNASTICWAPDWSLAWLSNKIPTAGQIL